VLQRNVLTHPNSQQHNFLFDVTQFCVMQVTSVRKGEGENTKGRSSCTQPAYSENI